MNINRNDLKSLQSAYRTVLTESQETGYNGGMNNNSAHQHTKLSKAFKQVVDQIINNYVQDPVEGRAIEELVVTDLTENGFIDDEFQDVLYGADGEMDFKAEQQVHDMVTAYVKSRLGSR
jgi:hypothetical protein